MLANETIEALVVLYTCFTCVFSILFTCSWIERFGKIEKIERYFLSPKYIRIHSNMNSFGVILTFILLFILAPCYYIILFVYWICHV